MSLRTRRGTTRSTAVLLSLVLLSASAACGGSTSGSGGGSNAASAILNVATTADITTWDPIKSFSTEVFYLANVYEPLLWKNPAGSAQPYKPALATSWESSADKLTWTFHLRTGVTFHDGEPMNADAVKASIEASADHGGASFIWAPLKSIDTPDENTVVMHLTYAAPMDLIASSMYGAWIVSPKALAAVKADSTYFDSGKDGGTGPYTISEYTSGTRVVLKKYAAYWGGWAKNSFSTVVNTITPEAVVQQQMLSSGQADLASSLPLENISQFKNNPKFTVTSCKTDSDYVGFFNTTRKPLTDVRVRQALSYAIPYQDIITIGAQGYGTQSRGPVPAGVFPYSDATPQYQQNLDKAKALLAAAGYAGGNGLKLNITYAAENQAEARFAPLIKDAFAKIGVTANVQALLFNQQWAQAKADPSNAQDIFLLLYWPTYADAGSDNLYSLFHSSAKPSFNLSYWNDPTYDKLIDDASTYTATDNAKALSEYGQAMSRLYDQAPGFFLYDVTQPMVVPSDIKGMTCNQDYSFNYFFHDLTRANG